MFPLGKALLQRPSIAGQARSIARLSLISKYFDILFIVQVLYANPRA